MQTTTLNEIDQKICARPNNAIESGIIRLYNCANIVRSTFGMLMLMLMRFDGEAFGEVTNKKTDWCNWGLNEWHVHFAYSNYSKPFMDFKMLRSKCVRLDDEQQHNCVFKDYEKKICNSCEGSHKQLVHAKLCKKPKFYKIISRNMIDYFVAIWWHQCREFCLSL